jgi:hypothetical protein
LLLSDWAALSLLLLLFFFCFFFLFSYHGDVKLRFVVLLFALLSFSRLPFVIVCPPLVAFSIYRVQFSCFVYCLSFFLPSVVCLMFVFASSALFFAHKMFSKIFNQKLEMEWRHIDANASEEQKQRGERGGHGRKREDWSKREADSNEKRKKKKTDTKMEDGEKALVRETVETERAD